MTSSTRPPVRIDDDHALLTNLGDRFTLRVEAGGHVVDQVIRLADLAEDESPRDAAMKRINALGWQVVLDGSWWVGAWTGPGADRTWAYLEPAVDGNGEPR